MEIGAALFAMDRPLFHAKKALDQAGQDLKCRWDAVGKGAERLWSGVCGNVRATGQQLTRGRATGVALAVSGSLMCWGWHALESDGVNGWGDFKEAECMVLRFFFWFMGSYCLGTFSWVGVGCLKRLVKGKTQPIHLGLFRVAKGIAQLHRV